MGNIVEEGDSDAIGTEEKIVNVQCFPLYSILLAMGQRRRVDFFSLDIEGHELKVLKTIPFHKIDFRVCTKISVHLLVYYHDRTTNRILNKIINKIEVTQYKKIKDIVIKAINYFKYSIIIS